MRPLMTIPLCLAALLVTAETAQAKTELCGTDGSGKQRVAEPCLVDSGGTAVKTPSGVSYPALRGGSVAVTWSRWGQTSAVGHGTWEYPGPDGYVDIPFRVTLDKVKACAPTGQRIFSRLTVKAARKRDARRLPRALREADAIGCSVPDRAF